jgi:DNA-binding beta-propeller fold protein YncE
VKKIMYIKINNEGAKKALVSISIMVIIIVFTSAVVVSLVPLSSVEGDRESNNPLGFKSIKKFDSNGKSITSWGSEGYGDGQFWLPHDIAIDSSDNVYVTDSGNVHEKKDNCTI